MRIRLRLWLVALGVSAVAAFAAGAAHAYVYWSVAGTHAIGRANLDASGVNHTFVSASSPAALAVDQSHIYWGNGSSIGRANLNGSGAVNNWIAVPGAFQIDAIVTDGTYIYWDTDSTTIGRARLDGSNVQPGFITVQGVTAGALAIANGTLYYDNGNRIESVPTTGGASTQFIAAGGIPTPQIVSLAAGNGNLYWSELKGISALIETAPLGTAQESTLVTGSFNPAGVATDGTYLYWVEAGPIDQPDQIARAQINGDTVSNTVHDFISEPNTAADVAVDAGIDQTSTTVRCAPAIVPTGQASACTATVTDSTSSAPPTGTVNFAGPAAFFSGAPCQLTHTVGAAASCTVGAILTVAGSQAITASYAGDMAHQPSAGAATICSGATAICAPSPPPPKCIVPKLKGKTLSQARTALSRAHCKLGKVTKPKHPHGRLVVASTKPPAGSKLPSGARVAVKLGLGRKH